MIEEYTEKKNKTINQPKNSTQTKQKMEGRGVKGICRYRAKNKEKKNK